VDSELERQAEPVRPSKLNSMLFVHAHQCVEP
jgi:hypothetical protein